MQLPILLFQVSGFLINLVIALFVVYYFMKLRSKEKDLETKETKIDTNYHQIVDDALTKERKILDDAAAEAGQIITQAQYVNTTSKQTIDQALQKMIADLEHDAQGAASEFKKSYGASLNEIATTSLQGFKGVAHELQTDLEKQIKEFHESLLPTMQKELEAYKQSRLKQAEHVITQIVQEASQDILNKSISFEDHQKLMIDSLEKAKKEGLFD